MRAYWFSQFDFTRKVLDSLFFRASKRFLIDYLSASHSYYINCHFCENSLIFTFRYYSQSSRHIIFSRSQMFFTNYQRLLRYYNHYYHNFQGSFEAFVSKQCPPKQRFISLSQFINYLKRSHAGVSQSIACISKHFRSIETLFSHIFSGLRLSVFWCASDNYQILFPKYRFLTKSEIFVWWLWTGIRTFKDIIVFILRLFIVFSLLLPDIHFE